MNKGISILELVLVFGLLSSLAVAGSYPSAGIFISTTKRLDAERGELFITAAAGRALRHICAHPSCTDASAHGTYLSPAGQVLFEGRSLANRRSELDLVVRNLFASRVGSTSQWVFWPGK